MNPESFPAGGRGFEISDQPVVESHRTEINSVALAPGGFGVGLGDTDDESLFILARDPRSLFVYRGLDWNKHFSVAEADAMKLHLRVLRDDGSEETTTSFDPSVSFAFVDVTSPGTRYYCELGIYEGNEWKRVGRSNSAETPAAAISDDFSADFATLPLHLSFQRLLDIFRTSPARSETLVEAVSKMQTKARALQASMSPLDWSQLIETASNSVDTKLGLDLTGIRPPEIAALLRTVQRDSSRWIMSREKSESWRELGERFVGSSWSGSSAAGSSSWQSGRGGES